MTSYLIAYGTGVTINGLTGVIDGMSGCIISSTAKTTGKYYIEVKVSTDPSYAFYATVGVVNSNATQPTLVQSNDTFCVYPLTGVTTPTNLYWGAVAVSGDTVCLAIDMDALVMRYRVNNGEWSIPKTMPFANIKFLLGSWGTAGVKTSIVNFGASSLKYPLPYQYSTWDNTITGNDPSIGFDSNSNGYYRQII